MNESRNVELKFGEKLLIDRLTPPVPEDCRLLDLLPRTWTVWDKEKERRIKGDLVDLFRDYFFVGKTKEKPVGNVWYTHPLDSKEVATLGSVYIRPEYRKKGIAMRLMEAALQDFFKEGPKLSAIYLNTRRKSPAHKIYRNFGFRDYNFTDSETVMRLARPSPEEFDEEYFSRYGKGRIREAHRGDLPRMEAFINGPGWEIKIASHEVFDSTPYEPQFVETMNEVDEDNAQCFVLENEKGRISAFALLSKRERASILDFFGMPNYLDRIPDLVGKVISEISEEIHSYVALKNEVKPRLLEAVGFELGKKGVYKGMEVNQYVLSS